MDCMPFIISTCFVQVSYRPRGFGCLLLQCQWCTPPPNLDTPPPPPKSPPTPPSSTGLPACRGTIYPVLVLIPPLSFTQMV